MKHLLIDFDSTIPNLALMKISAWAKARGDEVYLNTEKDDPDYIWLSCLFTWNKEKAKNKLYYLSIEYPHAKIEYGGTGFDAGKPYGDTTRKYLPPEIEKMNPDYSLYNDDRAIGFCQRGCNRKCQFCLPPESLIITENGMKRIDSINVGDKVLTHKGRFRSVTKIYTRHYEGKLYRLSSNSASNWKMFETWLTPEHPVFTRHVSYRSGGQILTKFNWINAEHLKEKNRRSSRDRFAYPRIKEILDIDEYDGETIDVNMMTLIGYYLSEGYLSKNNRRGYYSVTFTFGKSEQEHQYALKAQESYKNLGYRASVYHYPAGWRVVMSRVKLTRWFLREFGEGAGNKKIPNWVKLLPEDKLSILLSTYMEGDGCKGRWHERAVTISPELAIGIRDISLKLGYIPHINPRSGDFHTEIQGRKVNAKDIYTVMFRKPSKSKRSVISDENYLYETIRTTETKEYCGDVYNLEVEEDNSYTTPFFCVHNCDVWRKEGRIEDNEYHRLTEWVPPDRKKILLLDNDIALFDRKRHDEILHDARDMGAKLSITQGYDIRVIADEPDRALDLAENKPYDTNFRRRTLYIAWDYLHIEKKVRKGIEALLDAGFKGYEIKCYIIVGSPDRWFPEPYRYYPERDLYRADVLWKEYGVYPWVMPYNNVKTDQKIIDFERWINKYLFKIMDFKDYDRNMRKNKSRIKHNSSIIDIGKFEIDE